MQDWESTISKRDPATDGPVRRRPQLTPKSIDKLRKTVRLIVDDCICWYHEDEQVFASSKPEELVGLVSNYLANREWYQRGLIDDLSSDLDVSGE